MQAHTDGQPDLTGGGGGVQSVLQPHPFSAEDTASVWDMRVSVLGGDGADEASV